MKYIVDRIEDGVVVLEGDKSHVTLKLSDFDFELSEGDVIYNKEGKFFKDDSEKDSRKRSILDLQSRILKKNKNF